MSLLPPMIFGKEQHMSDEINDLRTYLAEEGADLTQEQVRVLDEFIGQLGGIENATLAIKLLNELDEAA
jgi:hypothetical protein